MRIPGDSPAAGPQAAPLAEALRACRGALAGVGVFSGALNVLMLTGSLFMLQVYDRVLPSRSVPTLVGLIIIVAVLYAPSRAFSTCCAAGYWCGSAVCWTSG